MLLTLLRIAEAEESIFGMNMPTKKFITQKISEKDFHCSIAFKTWPQIKDKMGKHFKELKEKATAKAAQEKANG